MKPAMAQIICGEHRLLHGLGVCARFDAMPGITAQIAAGKTPAEIDAYLSQFDVWDRYDYDGDGNFNEPDGYIDHFQIRPCRRR